MTLETHVEQARTRVSDERAFVVDKRRAFEEFERNVRETPVHASGGPSGATRQSGELFTATASTVAGGTSANRCKAVCEAFAETVHPCTAAGTCDAERLVETMREELGSDLTAALAPRTAGQFTSPTKQALLEKVTERHRELDVMVRALDAESESLRSAAETTGAVTDWLADVNETPLLEFGFDELQAHHETLAAHRRDCDRLVGHRQEFLAKTTSSDAAAAIEHRTLAEFLYTEFPVEFPALATAVSLYEACADCQRAVRDHLARRV